VGRISQLSAQHLGSRLNLCSAKGTKTGGKGGSSLLAVHSVLQRICSDVTVYTNDIYSQLYIRFSNNKCRYLLNIWDVGGQKTLRSYWRNYFEQTDGLVWVVDSADSRRLQDCAEVSLTLGIFG